MTETENYHLNQWDAADPVRRGDFNADNVKIDAAFQSLSDAVGAETAAREAAVNALNGALAACGNCGIDDLTYSGTGTVGLKLTFPRRPLVVIIFDDSGIFVIAVRDMSHAHMHNVNYITARWEGNSVMLSYSDQPFMNTPGQLYTAVALVDMRE